MQFDITPYDGQPFEGAKLALYLGARLAVILRDATPGLIFADHWDLPGGGREGGETPLVCALRECREELGLIVPEGNVVWGAKFYEGVAAKWFYVAQLPQQFMQDVAFGDEGQGWTLMEEDRFLHHPKAVPVFQERLSIWKQTQSGNI
ncbi:NUDIX hydrolase [uncultured Sulfitobacter sp.]|uniref:NUDIX hydrolase n=1 Tax=uncultured Sulfitobacter sp. TaxID=191468 RepID=UPI002617AB9B|nr:NUDIX hydrolase [uncultured Sulfitobacter sp.]